jgi:hypothetical protein
MWGPGTASAMALTMPRGTMRQAMASATAPTTHLGIDENSESG